MEYPKKPVSCKCDDHLDKLESEIELPISARRLYELMFSDEQNVTPATNGGVWEKKAIGTEGHGKNFIYLSCRSLLVLTSYRSACVSVEERRRRWAIKTHAKVYHAGQQSYR